MEYKYKDLTVFATKLNSNLVSVTSQPTSVIGLNGGKNNSETIYKTNNLELAVQSYI